MESIERFASYFLHPGVSPDSQFDAKFEQMVHQGRIVGHRIEEVVASDQMGQIERSLGVHAENRQCIAHHLSGAAHEV